MSESRSEVNRGRTSGEQEHTELTYSFKFRPKRSKPTEEERRGERDNSDTGWLDLKCAESTVVAVRRQSRAGGKTRRCRAHEAAPLALTRTATPLDPSKHVIHSPT